MNPPIFVIGALRSGTTLFRLMLDSHDRISNPGEVDFIFDYIPKGMDPAVSAYDFESLRIDRTFLSYKLVVPHLSNSKEVALNFVKQFGSLTERILTLNIHRNLDKVITIFPDAKFIHIVRDPRDVAKSHIGMGWAGNTYYGVDNWVQTEASWDICKEGLIKSNLMELQYEALVTAPKENLEKVCSFIGVEFSGNMLNYPKHSTYGAPDPNSINQWKKFLNKREISLAESKSRPLLLARNYELSGYPLLSPRLLERIQLALANKLYRWRFAVERYGFYNVIMERITKKVMKSRHYVFIRKIDEITKMYLK
jgi:hypothetical protein